MWNAYRSGEILLKSFYKRSANKLRTANDRGNRLIDLALNRQVLRVQIGEWHPHLCAIVQLDILKGCKSN